MFTGCAHFASKCFRVLFHPKSNNNKKRSENWVLHRNHMFEYVDRSYNLSQTFHTIIFKSESFCSVCKIRLKNIVNFGFVNTIQKTNKLNSELNSSTFSKDWNNLLFWSNYISPNDLNDISCCEWLRMSQWHFHFVLYWI